MLLWAAQFFEQFYNFFAVFQYLTLRSILSALTALTIALSFGPFMIRWLESAQMGQTVRSDGPQSHLKKQGTPTMGGGLIIVAISVSMLLWGDLQNRFVWIAILSLIGFGIVGWVDDYRKIIRKDPKGLPARWKYLWQSLLGASAAVILYLYAQTPAETELTIPFVKHAMINLGLFYIVLTYFVIGSKLTEIVFPYQTEELLITSK